MVSGSCALGGGVLLLSMVCRGPSSVCTKHSPANRARKNVTHPKKNTISGHIKDTAHSRSFAMRIPFTTQVPFVGGTQEMPRTQVTGDLTFSVDATGLATGTLTRVELVADGIHAPTYAEDISAWPGPGGMTAYSNVAGTVNLLQFYSTDAGQFYLAAPVGTAPYLCGVSVEAAAITVEFSETMRVSAVPPPSAFTLSAGTVTGVQIVGSTVVLSGTLEAGSITVTYVAPANASQCITGRESGQRAGDFTVATV
eukprot:m.25370 g.25370  ORF g.25370 m.25370 type:complete len:254 (+) comp9744_c0_seq1:210-971(+)